MLAPLVEGRCDFVIGSRTRGKREAGSLTPHQLIAGRLLGAAMRALYGVGYTDMAPFRAIRRDVLMRLGMQEETYGWNLEMQMRAPRKAGRSSNCRWRIAAAPAGSQKYRATCAAH